MGPEDYFEGALRGGHREDDIEEEFSETLLLVVLCGVVALLIWMRTRIIDRLRRDQREHRPPPVEEDLNPPAQNGQAQGGQGLNPPRDGADSGVAG